MNKYTLSIVIIFCFLITSCSTSDSSVNQKGVEKQQLEKKPIKENEITLPIKEEQSEKDFQSFLTDEKDFKTEANLVLYTGYIGRNKIYAYLDFYYKDRLVSGFYN